MMQNHFPPTKFERIFVEMDDPAVPCANCLCKYCTHNVYEVHNTVMLDEVSEESCLNCDECREYTGDFAHRRGIKESCDSFRISDYGARRKKGKFRII